MSNERVLSSLLDTLFPCLVGDGDGVNLYSLRGSQFKGLPLKVRNSDHVFKSLEIPVEV